METLSGFAAIGNPISFNRKQNAYEFCKEIGLTKEQALTCINQVSEKLERDQPYEAQRIGLQWIDLTGVYRLFALLLAS